MRQKKRFSSSTQHQITCFILQIQQQEKTTDSAQYHPPTIKTKTRKPNKKRKNPREPDSHNSLSEEAIACTTQNQTTTNQQTKKYKHSRAGKQILSPRQIKKFSYPREKHIRPKRTHHTDPQLYRQPNQIRPQEASHKRRLIEELPIKNVPKRTA